MNMRRDIVLWGAEEPKQQNEKEALLGPINKHHQQTSTKYNNGSTTEHDFDFFFGRRVASFAASLSS